MSFIQKMKPAKQMKPSQNLPEGIDRNYYWSVGGKKGEKIISEVFRFGNAAERYQSVINTENTAKILSNLSKTLGRNINPNELKVISLAKKTNMNLKYLISMKQVVSLMYF